MNLPTEKQLNFIRNLRDSRVLDEGDEYLVARVLDVDDADMHDKKVASGCIEMLLKRPERTQAPKASNGDNYGIPGADVLPTGRYAIYDAAEDLTFYRVWRGTRNPDYVKVYLLHGPDETEIPFGKGMVTILKLIAQEPAEAAVRYGHEIGHCSVCAKRLTNRVSRALGIGPICGGHFYGEEFKSVVHGAREHIKAQGLDPDGNVEDDETVARYDIRSDFEPVVHEEVSYEPAPKAILAEEHTPESTWVERDESQPHAESINLAGMTDAELTSLMTRAATILEERSSALMGR